MYREHFDNEMDAILQFLDISVEVDKISMFSGISEDILDFYSVNPCTGYN